MNGERDPRPFRRLWRERERGQGWKGMAPHGTKADVRARPGPARPRPATGLTGMVGLDGGGVRRRRAGGQRRVRPRRAQLRRQREAPGLPAAAAAVARHLHHLLVRARGAARVERLRLADGPPRPAVRVRALVLQSLADNRQAARRAALARGPEGSERAPARERRRGLGRGRRARLVPRPARLGQHADLLPASVGASESGVRIAVAPVFARMPGRVHFGVTRDG